MAVWEYLRVIHHHLTNTVIVKGEVFEGDNIDLFTDYLGERGWELVGFSTTVVTTDERQPLVNGGFINLRTNTHTDSELYIFKRLKQE